MHSRTVRPLQDKLETLTAENTALRDANDELTLKLEELHASRYSGKK
jgi:predicted nuclease with TOPRIM domain